jgi:hypothetical protein
MYNFFRILITPLFIITIFFPFASFFPLKTDIQPIVFFLALFFIFPLNKKEFQQNRGFYLYFLFFGLMSILYFNFNSVFNFTRRFNILSSFILFLGMSRVFDSIHSKIIRNISFMHFFFLLMQFISPSLFSTLFGFLIGRVTYGDFENVRGVHGLNSEPGGASAVLFGVFFMSLYLREFRYKLNSIDVYNCNLSITFCLLGFLLTKSGLGFLLFFLSILLLIPLRKRVRFFAYFLIFIFFILNITKQSNLYFKIRGLDLIFFFIQNPTLIIYLDGSIAERFLGLSYGLHSLLHFPFGLGGGAYPIVASKIESIYGLSRVYFSARSQIEDTVSALGVYLSEYGIFFIIFLVILLNKILSYKYYNIIVSFVVLSFITFSFSIALPITWLLVIILIKIKRHDKNIVY